MSTFGEWWAALSTLNQWFFVAAAFFSVFFLWQLVATLMGLGGEEQLDTHVDSAWEHQTPDDADQTVVAFKLISIRSLIAFFTLFTWAGALYLSGGAGIGAAMLRAILWGVVAMLIVSFFFYLMRRMTETGNIKVDSCVGTVGTVHLDIPAQGDGEIRVLVSGVMTHLKARSGGDSPFKAGQTVRVTKMVGPNIVEVEPAVTKAEQEKSA